ncbi:MAG: histidine kinase, partial [Spirochaetes bacterium]|nr:histidine kinase [Spirochaetota bacterium]
GKIGKFSDKVSELLEYFHENFDGSGYPNGIKGKKIPEWARVCRIADTYVALTSLRPYRKAMSKNKAIEELKKNRGTSFDPNLLNIFFEVIENKPLPA